MINSKNQLEDIVSENILGRFYSSAKNLLRSSLLYSSLLALPVVAYTGCGKDESSAEQQKRMEELSKFTEENNKRIEEYGRQAEEARKKAEELRKQREELLKDLPKENSANKYQAPSAAQISPVRGIAFVSKRGAVSYAEQGISIINPENSQIKELTDYSVKKLFWSQDGRKIFFTNYGNSVIGSMNADGTDIKTIKPSGEFIRDVKISPDGTKLAFSALDDRKSQGDFEIYIMNVDGSGKMTNLTNNEPTMDATADDSLPAWSPDGKKIVFISNRDLKRDEAASKAGALYIITADGLNTRKLIDLNLKREYYELCNPVWSPNGGKIAFIDDFADLFIVNEDGTGLEKLTNKRHTYQIYMMDLCWSPDGNRIVFSEESREPSNGAGGDQRDIYIIDADGKNFKNLTCNEANDKQPIWSPDGKKIAFISGRDGREEGKLYIMDADGTNVKRLIDKVMYERNPVWSPAK